MKIGFAQITGRDTYAENVEQCLDFLTLGSKLELDVLCFPELPFTPFFPSRLECFYPFQIAEGIPGPTMEHFQRLAKQLCIAVVLNCMERFNHEFYNASPVIDCTGKLLGVSRMVHVPQVPGYYAQSYFTASCGDFYVYPTRAGRIGVLISYDRHFPEASRALTIHDAEILLIPGHITRDQGLSLVKAELQTIASQNSVFVGMCSRTGREGETDHIGHSFLIGPSGEILAEGGEESELVVAEADLEDIRRTRERIPYLRLRRPDEYLDILKTPAIQY